MNIPCWISGHKWLIINHHNYDDISYGACAKSCCLTLKCEKCGNVKVKHFYASGYYQEKKDQ